MTETPNFNTMDVSRIQLDITHVQEFFVLNPLNFPLGDNPEFKIEHQIFLYRQPQPDRIVASLTFDLQPVPAMPQEGPVPFCHCVLLFGFQFPDLPDFIITDHAQGEKIAPHLHVTLAALAYSTARGMLIRLTQGTLFQPVILPVVAPGDLLRPH
ncbi:MAG: hypothetical protein SF053_01705 [Bacteroidia bacterium]|nr:hypothetical protein [Bacteroidia bacterium]